ncbi:MAG: hypothetical protein ABWK01_08020 [Infirmifilum sp.]
MKDPSWTFKPRTHEELKRRFIELLMRDIEFRYAVVGYLGIAETLKRLDALLQRLDALAKEQVKLWEEVRALREWAFPRAGARVWGRA